MTLKANRQELAEYAAEYDVQSLTGLFLAEFEGQVQGLTITRINAAQAGAQVPGGPQLAPTPSFWGAGNWGAENKAANEFVRNLTVPVWSNLLLQLQADANNWNNLQFQARRAFYEQVRSLLALVPGLFSYNTGNNTVSDERQSRLIRRMDLTEWIAIPNKDILYYVITEAEGERHQAPLGRATVWVNGGSLVHIVRSKTAKSFVRGEITRQLKSRELEPDLEGLYRAFFDVDAEDAFSSNLGAC